MTDYTQCRLPQLLEEMKIAVLVIGRDDGIIRYANGCVCRDMGKALNEIIGRHHRDVFWPEFIPVYSRLLVECGDGNEHSAVYYWASMTMWEQLSARTVVWDGVPAILLYISNISEIARSEYMTESKVHFDSLLKLPNGAKLEADINDIANVETVGLIYFEIVRLKDINNLYGWDNGDYLLTQIRDWMLTSEHQNGQLYRLYNGFASLGRKVTLRDAECRAQQILDRFTRPWALNVAGNTISVFCPIKLGIVYGKYVKNEMRNLLLRTIEAVEDHTKYVIYDDEMDKESRRQVKLRNDLVCCVYERMAGFEVYYQPIVGIGSGRWIGAEALCRWTTPDGHAVPPDVFIPVAEQLGLVGNIDEWMRRTAIKQCTEMGLDQKEFTLDVNLSPKQRIDDDFLQGLHDLLSQTGYPPEKLRLEVTESTKMIFDEDNLHGLARLLEEGVSLGLDDFGTGYSSFENLFKMPAALLKTEKMMLDGIEDDGYRQYILHMLVDLANQRGMQLVAEGVETLAQHKLLKTYKVDFAQGYLFSKPLSLQQMKERTCMYR